MKANETTFQKLVEGSKQFQIPLYQRPYSWGKEELQRLWDDLTEQVATDLAAEESGRPASPHFMGSVVLAPGVSFASKLSRSLVIDGQQRLTTLSIALAAIRDRLQAVEILDPEDFSGADKIDGVYLINQFEKKDDRYRLSPTQVDRASYHSVIRKSASAGTDDNVGFAYNYFSRMVVDYDEKQLMRMEETIGHRLTLVEIVAEPGDNVYRIFESLNNTGKGLSQTDLLRNYVFMLLPKSGEEVYDDVWLPMQEELGPDRLETLAWLDLVLRGDDRAKQSEVYHGQKERLEKAARDGGEPALREELEQLRRRGRLLLRVIDPGYEDAPELAAVLQRLVDWGNMIYRPLALHLMDLRDQGHVGTEELVRALGYVESFLVRRMIAGVPTQGLNRIFTSSPKEIRPGGSVADSVRRYLSDPRRRWPTDSALTEAVANRNFYWSGRGPQRTYVLRRLEESYGSPEPVDFSKAQLSIEHVMPQRLTKQWKVVLGGQTAPGETHEELHARLLHTLGNLTLTAQNSKLSNHMFERKQSIFDSSALWMNKKIADTASWGRPEIESRAIDLAQRALALWPAPLDAGQDAGLLEETVQEQIGEALAMVAAESWTTHRELALLAGTSPATVADFLEKHQHAVQHDRVFANTAVAERAGVDRDRFFSAAALAELLGLEIDRAVERERGFRDQLLECQQPETARATLELLDEWTALGGALRWGDGIETSCFMRTWDQATSSHQRWALTLYPRLGTAEVVFQHMRGRPPFDAVEMRRELLDRLNAVPGVALPEDALERRPNFRLEALVGDSGRQVLEVLTWFRERCQEWLTARG
ncbi:DUF262 domain-containing protein [Nocardiopsis sp. M1B1]|uniref:DUF262 domain-containing protein n=1 Tax=Nocardiopsis sp. M1B1 TaxID=3450454 RepID=UPI00403985AC